METILLAAAIFTSATTAFSHSHAKTKMQSRTMKNAVWDISTPHKPVWSQAFSLDNGDTWEWNWHMYFTKTDFVDPAFNKHFRESDKADSIGIIEIRNYLLKPGRRDEFIRFFESTFINSQQELKGYPLGQYRVRESDDNFCWIRGFEDFPQLPVFQDKNLLVTITFYDDEQAYHAKSQLVSSKMNKNTEAQYYDAVTIKNTLILYPTAFTKSHSISQK